MDSNTGGILGVVSIIVTSLGAVYAAVNHKRVRSNCCGKIAEASLDIDTTTPPVKAVSSQPPAGQPVNI